MIIKVSMNLVVDDAAKEEVKKLEHHIDWLLDLASWPEIQNVFGVKVVVEE